MLRWLVLVVFVSVLTSGICLFNPVLHKSIVITDAGMRVVDEPVKTQNNVQLQPVKQEQPKTKINVKQQPVKPTANSTRQPAKPQVKKVTKNVQTKTTKSVQKTVQKSVKPIQTKTVASKPKTTTQLAAKPPVKAAKPAPPKQKVLTQQEETILWNKWHSNLQNRIISDTTARLKKLDSATKQSINGTLYIMYSFTVSKNGSISNISVKTNISNEASQQVKSIVTNLISGYRGSSLLIFPKGTTRSMEQHKGAISTVIKNAQSTTYSNTNDYNRYNETVKR